MRAQVNFIVRRKKGDTRKTREFNTTTLRIGRATDQEIFLPDIRVAYEHAQILQGADNAIYLEAKVLSGVRINDEPAASSDKLPPGTRIGVGSYEIRVRDPCPDFDLIVDVEQVQTEKIIDAALLRNAKIDLAGAGWGKRRGSWILFIVILVLFFFVPLIGSYIEPVQKVLKAVPLFSDSVWTSGDLAPVHHFFRQDCKACHQTPFIRVKNEACTQCHRKTHEHADSTRFEIVEDINNARCSSCHEEHNGTGIVVRDEALCTNCHAELTDLVEKDTALIDVGDFGSDHPEFRVSIPVVISKPDQPGGRESIEKVQRIGLSDSKRLKEMNTLLFSHKAHLKPEGVRTLYVPEQPGADRIPEQPGGERIKLNCENCHIPDSGGLRMQRITFDRFCKDCHQLNFEPSDNKRVVPHGEAGEVVYYLEQYYKSRALEGGFEDPGAPQVVRRQRPGRQRLSQEETREALAWASEKAREIGNQVFMYRSCHTCHDVTRDSSGSTWTISPVRIPEHWMPKSVFNHAKHVTMECLDCHKAENSENGSDVLLTGIAKCQNCHGGAEDSRRLATTCIQCHKFHVGEGLLGLGARETPARTVEAKP